MVKSGKGDYEPIGRFHGDSAMCRADLEWERGDLGEALRGRGDETKWRVVLTKKKIIEENERVEKWVVLVKKTKPTYFWSYMRLTKRKVVHI